MASTSVISRLGYGLSLRWLTGPIFEKELRVASRRRRNYVLRFSYILFLIIFVVGIYLVRTRNFTFPMPQDNPTMEAVNSQLAQVQALMAEYGKTIVLTVIWFQFVVLQIAAVAMLSTSISEEIERRTLGVLLATPITSLQIVAGKLLSRLGQLFLLVAISFPALATLRVFGGVPWDFLLRALAVTFTAVLYAATVTLFISTKGRKGYATILRSLAALVFQYILIPILIVAIVQLMRPNGFGGASTPLLALIGALTPPVVLQFLTIESLAPNNLPALVVTYAVPIHCGVMLLLSAVLLVLSVRRTKRAMRANALGQGELVETKPKKQRGKQGQSARAEAPLRRITGHPVVWKELRQPMIRGSRRLNRIAFIIVVATLLMTYVIGAFNDSMHYHTTQELYTVMLMGLALLATTVLSAVAITSEKESGAWPILLATTLSEREIILGKFVGALRRSGPIWFLLGLHIVLFTALRYLHPLALVQFALVALWSVTLSTCSGLYFSARLRRTSAAVATNLILMFLLWLAPLMSVVFVPFGGLTDLSKQAGYWSPLGQALTIARATGGNLRARGGIASLHYDVAFRRMRIGAGEFTMTLIVVTVIALVISAVLYWRARRLIRTKVV